MKILFLILAILVGIVGCDSPAFDNAIKKAIRAKLKDPDSAKFENEIVVQTRACISVNAKNSFGGYTGAKIAHLKDLGSSNWYVETLDGEPCYVKVLESKLLTDKIDRANKEYEKMILDKLKANKLVGAKVQSVYSIEDKKCKDIASDLMTYIRLVNGASAEEDKKYWQTKVSRKMAVVDSGSCNY